MVSFGKSMAYATDVTIKRPKTKISVENLVGKNMNLILLLDKSFLRKSESLYFTVIEKKVASCIPPVYITDVS